MKLSWRIFTEVAIWNKAISHRRSDLEERSNDAYVAYLRRGDAVSWNKWYIDTTARWVKRIALTCEWDGQVGETHTDRNFIHGLRRKKHRHHVDYNRKERASRGSKHTHLCRTFYTARKLKSYTIQNSNAPQSPWSEFKLIFPSHVSFPTDESISSTWKLLLYIRHWFLLLISVSFNSNTELTIFIKWKHRVLYNDLKRKIRFWYPDIKNIIWFTYIGRLF